MTAISQRIPNLFGGISQQPDLRKRPGELTDASNVYPDYALGMLKRPGGKFKSQLQGATATGKWFNILRDDQEKYVGQFADNVFRIWSAIDGSPRTVNMGSNMGVPASCNYANFQTDLVAYNTAVAATKTALAALQAAEAVYAEAFAGQTSTQINLIDSTYTYNTNVKEFVRSGIVLSQNGIYLVKDNGVSVSAATTLPANYSLGTEVTDLQPIIGSSGVKVFEAIKTIPATHTAAQLATAQTALTAAETAYANAKTAEATAKTAYDAEVANCAISTPGSTYLSGTQPDDIEFLTLNDYTFVLNKKKEVAMTTSVTALRPNEAFVVVNVVAYNAAYKINLDGTSFTYNTPDDVSAAPLSAESIAGALRNSIDANAGFSATQIGPGIYITSTNNATFSLEVAGGSQFDALFGFQDNIGTSARLPLQCRNGYIVKIESSAGNDFDNIYVKFTTDNGQNNGTGTWQECLAPGLVYELDASTLPHQLVRQADGTFSFNTVSWVIRKVGDDDTNPIPTFVGKTITDLFFYRNRFGFLSSDSVILSKAGDFFNFFATSALTATADDPIDIAASSTRPVFLNYVSPSSIGLVLYGQNEQFLLSTDSDILSPLSSKINTLSSYESDSSLHSVSLGTSQAFVSKTPLYTRLFELFDVSDEKPPVFRDNTQSVPELIPSSVDSIISSPGLSMVSLASSQESTVYQFKYFNTSEKREIQTWYKWELTGKILHQYFDDNEYFAVVFNPANEVFLNSYDMNQSSENGFLKLNSGERTDVCLDSWYVNPHRTYTTLTNITKIYLPFDHFTGSSLNVLVLGGLIGSASGLSNQSVGAVLAPTVQGSAGNYFVEIKDDYRGRDLIIGYKYDMKITMPRFFVYTQTEGMTANDSVSDLIIHRLNVSCGLSGTVTYNVDIKGLDTHSNVISRTFPNQYPLNSVNLAAESLHVVPVYQRNKNLTVEIVGDTPMPVSILSIDWEGRYTKRFYQRV